MKLLRRAPIKGYFLLDLDEQDMASIIRRTLEFLIARGVLPAERRDEAETAILEREQQASTAIGNAVAVPHTYSHAFSEPAIVFVRLPHAINLGASDGVQTRFLFVLLGSTAVAAQHLDVLAKIARLASDDEFRFDAGRARNQLDLLEAMDRFRERTAPPPIPESDSREAFTQQGRLFGGLMDDIHRRLPHYATDLSDGLHTKCLVLVKARNCT